jgi:hypothetical protein
MLSKIIETANSVNCFIEISPVFGDAVIPHDPADHCSRGSFTHDGVNRNPSIGNRTGYLEGQIPGEILLDILRVLLTCGDAAGAFFIPL